MTRLVVTVPLVLHFAGLRWYRELDHLKLSLDAFKNKGYYWSVVTSPWWEPPGQGPGWLLQTLVTLLIAYWFLSKLPAIERLMSSGKLLLWSICSALVINMFFLLLVFLLDQLYNSQGWMSIWPMVPSRGMIPVTVYALTVHYLAAGDSETTLFFGIPLKRKYYPLTLVGVFCLLNGFAVELSNIAALLLGYLNKRVPIESLLPSDGRLQRWERSSIPFFGRSLLGGRWLRIEEATTLPLRPESHRHGHSGGHSGGPAPQDFRPFSGSGHRLGR